MAASILDLSSDTAHHHESCMQSCNIRSSRDIRGTQIEARAWSRSYFKVIRPPLPGCEQLRQNSAMAFPMAQSRSFLILPPREVSFTPLGIKYTFFVLDYTTCTYREGHHLNHLNVAILVLRLHPKRKSTGIHDKYYNPWSTWSILVRRISTVLIG
jgi:hypothetical protein